METAVLLYHFSSKVFNFGIELKSLGDSSWCNLARRVCRTHSTKCRQELERVSKERPVVYCQKGLRRSMYPTVPRRISCLWFCDLSQWYFGTVFETRLGIQFFVIDSVPSERDYVSERKEDRKLGWAPRRKTQKGSKRKQLDYVPWVTAELPTTKQMPKPIIRSLKERLGKHDWFSSFSSPKNTLRRFIFI